LLSLFIADVEWWAEEGRLHRGPPVLYRKSFHNFSSLNFSITFSLKPNHYQTTTEWDIKCTFIISFSLSGRILEWLEGNVDEKNILIESLFSS
jgi:hypothetical protein